jgi:translocator protein
MSYRMRSICNSILLIAMIVINYLSNALPFNGMTQKEIFAMYQIFLTPAGYVFSIWGVIYIGLSVYVLSQSLPKRLNDPRLRLLDLPFVLSCLFNIIWLFIWH